MSFSASTCLTNTGTTTLSSTLTMYSNPISPTNPGTYVTTVPTADITGGNCPYTFEVPDGTTSIRLSDPISGCYCDIPISDNDMCTTCTLNFNTYTSPSVGNIVAGDITGTCDASVSNYLINWYDVTDPLTPIFKFSSGKGTMFQPYDKVHPLTGATAVLATSGTYDAILEKIELNGVVFSRTGGTGTILADLDCLPSITNGDPFVVEALNCSNGTSDLPQYEHRFSYNAGTGGKTPEPLGTTFTLSAGTKYFPWKFQGNTVPDKIKLTLVADAYGDVPIIVDYWDVGGSIGSNTNPSVFPKSAGTTNFLNKITVLSAFTISDGDNILIEVAPSTANTQTSWTFYCGCVNEVNCFECSPRTGMTSGGTVSYQYPISASTFTAYTATCNSIAYSFKLRQDCDYSIWTGSTEYLYMGAYNIFADNIISAGNTFFVNRSICNLTNGPSPTISCLNYGLGTNITYNKRPGFFTITSNNPTVISTNYTRYFTDMVPYISPFSGDNTNIGYYKFINVNYPNSTGTTSCGDGTVSKAVYIHQSTTVTTGITGSDYFIEFTLPTITSGLTFSSCELQCKGYVDHIVSLVNNSSTGSTYNYTGTTNVGSTYNYILSYMTFMTQSTLNQVSINQTGSYNLNITSNFTYPASGNTPTLIPSLSGVTCPNITDYMFLNGALDYFKYTYYYTISLINPTDPTSIDINIFGNRLSKSGNSTTTNKTLIGQYIGGVLNIIDSDYFV